MRKKRGILGKVVIGVVVLGVIGAVFGGNDETPKEDPMSTKQEQQVQETVSENKPEIQKDEPKPAGPKVEETKPVKPAEPEKKESSGIRPELKEFLSSYEVFMDEYCEFMENYNASDMTMLMKYTELLSKYSDFAEKADKWQNEDMNNEELVYYTEVLNRVSVKLLEVSQKL